MKSQLYTFIDKQKLSELAEVFYDCIGLPIKILDDTGFILEQFGHECDYCTHFIAHPSAQDTCVQFRANAGKRALSLGESYIFSCSSNLFHIAFPLIVKGNLFGCILVGPFLMGDADSTLVMDLGQHFPDFTMSDLMELYDDTKTVPKVLPHRVTQISKLVYFLFSNILEESQATLQMNQTKLYQQAKISEAIHDYKKESSQTAPQYPIEKEALLLQNVKIGNLKKSKALLNDILGYIFSSAGNDIEQLKMRSIELCSLLSRAAMEKGAPPNQTLTLNNLYLKNMQNYNTIEDLCYSLNEVLETFIESLFPLVSSPNNKVIQDAMVYISANYSDPITLEDVANHVHLNSAYLSRIFKQVCGSSFKEYLTTIRIEESKRLLKNTDYALLDIAIATGFDDQSYFSKVFKKYTGLTPRQFRA